MTVPDLAQRLYERFGSWSKAARALNISGTALYAWRDGRAIPGFHFAAAIAAALTLELNEVRDVLIRAHEIRDVRGHSGRFSMIGPPVMPPVKIPPSRLMRHAHATA